MSTVFTQEQRAQLSAKLHPDSVKSRSQAGKTFAFIEGWHAIAEANRIFGFDGWCRETVDMKCVAEGERKLGKDQRPGWGVSYVCKVRVTVGGIIRDGAGSGHGIDVDRGLAHESAIKEAETDAMKRALMTFGNPFGLALYDKERANVGVDEPEPEPPRIPADKFAVLAVRVRQCPSVQAIDELIAASADVIAQIPVDRVPKWQAFVAEQRAERMQRRAA